MKTARKSRRSLAELSDKLFPNTPIEASIEEGEYHIYVEGEWNRKSKTLFEVAEQIDNIIKLYGEEPANFCDVGGGAGKEKVAAAFKIIMKDPKVKGILVNIFGGIMKCDGIAEGVLAAVRETNLAVPLVVRLEGTNAELGKKIIRDSGLNVIPANDRDDAAQKIVAAIKGK